MLIAAVALLFAPTDPTTFQDFEIAKLAAYHGLRNFTSDMRITMSAEGQTSELRLINRFDGEKYHSKVVTGEGASIEVGGDGKKMWAIFPGDKAYFEGPAEPVKPYVPKAHLLKVEKENFRFNFGTEVQVQFSCDPPFKIKSISTVKEGTTTLREVVASVTNAKGHTLNVTQWFLPDRWILKRFLLKGQTEAGATTFRGEATLNLNARFTSDEFKLDHGLVLGYVKRDSLPQGAGGG